MSAGEAGCALSHYRAWQSVTADYVLILEDDVWMNADLSAIMSAMPSGFDLVKLETSGLRVEFEDTGLYVGRGFTVHKLTGPHWRTGAYLISKDAAERFVKSYGFNMPVDWFLFGPYNGHYVGQVVPAPCVQDDVRGGIGGLRSGIGPGRWRPSRVKIPRGGGRAGRVIAWAGSGG